MPWPMVHFGIAEKLYKGQPSPSFLLGSIAPDAIHVRGQVTRAEKGATHFVTGDRFPSVEQLKYHCLHHLSHVSETEQADFVRGYIAHVYADMRWTETIYARFEQDFNNEGHKQSRGIRDVYNEEMSQTEFTLLRTQTWAGELLNMLRESSVNGLEPLVSEHEVCRYRELKLDWLNEPDNEPCIEPLYFSVEAVLAFIVQTADELQQLFLEWNAIEAELRGVRML
ncbi:hypothetical protein [Paenibacillus albus]|uniref:Phospholipase C/D domain-containing protein n=1 Tax=Paenibacillus albus TaxID=2495582 RepID=A0A3S9A5F9_9BACL|nr:hypothetical protein [Paenibacillus albus]AZN40978.1 hypothetical protein EJC50_15890 [Paenibacillus albus]